MKCSKCGNENSSDSVFCSSCGNKLEQVQNIVIENGQVKKNNSIKKVGLAGSIVILILSILTMNLIGIILSIVSIVKLSSANSMQEGNQRQSKIRTGKTCRTVAWILFILKLLLLIAAVIIVVVFGVGLLEYVSLDTSSINDIVDKINQNQQIIDIKITDDDTDKKSSTSTSKSTDKKQNNKDTSTSTKNDTTKSTTTDKKTTNTDVITESPKEVICTVASDFDENLKVYYLGEFENGKLKSVTGTVQIKTIDHDETYINSAKTIFGCNDSTVSCKEVNNILTISEKVYISELSEVFSSNTTPEDFKTLYTKTYGGTCN